MRRKHTAHYSELSAKPFKAFWKFATSVRPAE